MWMMSWLKSIDTQGSVTMRTRYRHSHIILLCAYALGEAWWIKCRKNLSQAPLEPPEQICTLTKDEIDQVLRWAKAWVRIGAWCTGRKCFFHAYIAGRVLNYLGCPVQMNVGLKLSGGKRRASGHCWLTLKDRPIGESSNPTDAYPIAMAHSNKGIRYWANTSPA
jgi:hypothetical protein